MKQGKNKTARLLAVLGVSVFLLGGCRNVTEEMLTARENGIHLLENGDYEGAIREFEPLIENARKVSEFELDILKYRAEAEFGLGDFQAAAYTYDTLEKVDGKKAEYSYFGALSLAKLGDLDGAAAKLNEGKSLDQDKEKPGYAEAMAALGDALEKNGNQNEARALYDELIAEGKATGKVYVRLMTECMESGRYEEALSFCTEGQARADGEALRQLKFNEAVCYEYLGQYGRALELFQAYAAEFGTDETAEHEIAFLKTRQ